MVEHSAVNRVVAGSSPARGVNPQTLCLWIFCIREIMLQKNYETDDKIKRNMLGR